MSVPPAQKPRPYRSRGGTTVKPSRQRQLATRHHHDRVERADATRATSTGSRPFDGYVRVSRVGGRSGLHFISPEVQEERIRAYARARGLTVGTVFCELDRSGTTFRRALVQQALQRIENGESGGLIVARLDRFARTVLEALEALSRINRAGGAFISVEDGLESSTPFGRAMMTILLALAETYAAIGTSLRARGVGGATNARCWSAKDVRRVLLNPVYLGEARAGSAVNRSAHPALVPRETWLLAQPGGAVRSSPMAQSLFAGLVRCSGCCHVLVRQRIKSPSDAAPRYAFRCRRTHTNGVCPMPAYVSATALEAIIADEYAQLQAAGGLRGLRVQHAAASGALERLVHHGVSGACDQRCHSALDNALGRLHIAARRATLAERNILRPSWAQMTMVERRVVLCGLFDAIIVQRGPPSRLRERITLIPVGALPEYFPLRGVTRPLRSFGAP